MKAKLYKATGLLFAIIGFFLFSYMYAQHSSGSFWQDFQNPFVIVIILFPFIPAIILSWMARRVEIKLNKVFTDTEE